VDDDVLDPGLASEVIDRLGVAGVELDGQGVAALYDAWCQQVPFDNLSKLIGLRDSVRPLPGDSADDFFRSWLLHGTGGTCWSSSNALTAVATALGFEAARVMGAMLDLPEPNHGSTVISVEGIDWMVDSSLLTGDPHQIGPLESRTDRYGYRSRLAPDGDTWMMHTDSARGFQLPCRIFRGVRTSEEYRDFHERTRDYSVFNQAPYVLRHLNATVQCLNDYELTIWSDHGISKSRLDDGDRHEWFREAGFSQQLLSDLGM
jgi:N-hydroxyarylamine O-acetyltransferase